MSYFKEDKYIDEIDCYWSSSDRDIYPSIPEPYINLFFPEDSSQPPLIKGISSEADYLEVTSGLFGVRLSLKGYMQMNLVSCRFIVNKIQPLIEIGGKSELDLVSDMNNANSFQDRINVFRYYYASKKENYTLSPLEINIAKAFNFIVSNFNDESVIKNCASFLEVSPRSVHRWFKEEMSINPKKLSRIVRFHLSVHHLLNDNLKFFYELGYFDQAHYIKEFKEFTGKTPERFSKFLSEKYNS